MDYINQKEDLLNNQAKQLAYNNMKRKEKMENKTTNRQNSLNIDKQAVKKLQKATKKQQNNCTKRCWDVHHADGCQRMPTERLGAGASRLAMTGHGWQCHGQSLCLNGPKAC